MIRLDVPAREIELLVDAAELERRKAECGRAGPPHRAFARLSRPLSHPRVLQADEGCDFDFC